MTITPPPETRENRETRDTGGTVTRSARNRSRRRLNASSSASVDSRTSHHQAELAPPRRRGRHAADEPEAGVAALTDVEFPAPAWDPWTTGTGPALDPARPAGPADPLDASGVVGGRSFWGDPAELSTVSGWTETGETSTGTGWADDSSGAANWTTPGDSPGATSWTEPGDSPGATGWTEPGDALPAADWAGADGRERAWEIWAETTGDDETAGRDSGATAGAGAGPGADETDADDPAGDRGRWAHARRTHSVYLKAALVRCGLYLGPLSVAVASAGALGRVAWPVPALMLLFGWTAAQGLTSVGVTVAGRGGPTAAARTVAAGFATVIGLWCALVWVAPDAWLGPDRMLAATVGTGGLLSLAAVTAALVTRSERAVAVWFTPCWLLAAAVLADAAGVGGAALIPVGTLLPAALIAAAIRAFRPAMLPARLTGRTGRAPRLTRADYRRGAAYLIIGAAQAVCVALLWQGSPAVMPLPAAVPLLLAVPLLEGLIGWHTARLDAALDSAETPEQFDRHVRNVTAITLAGLVPPLAAGCGLLVAAYRLPDGYAAVPGAREAVLALAAGTLLGGVFAVTFLLAARSRHGIAATLAAIPPGAAIVLALFASPAGMLPAAVAVLAATHLTGLLIVALTAADLRRTP
ncbi:hypothetical protein [Actinoplanes sp. G11-F43]|uniref:hypothetical protein n=1 Tax=Actinoplanes sp. G11-F43 TaxID=3424130 RepID=UPI003D327034